MSAQNIASRYAQSVIKVSLTHKVLHKVCQDMQGLGLLCKEKRDFMLFLRNLIITESKKVSVFKALFEGRVEQLTLSFLLLLARRRREALLPNIIQAFMAYYYAHTQQVEAQLTLPMQPDVTLQKKFLEVVKKITGKKPILTTRIDKDIIGGFLLNIGHQQLDKRVSTQLKNIQKHMTNN